MIEILETPPLNSIQDLGRVGFRRHGVARGGVMDRVALMAANALLGNDDGEAAIEFQLHPIRLRFTADTAFALTGADCDARLGDRSLPPWWSTQARAGEELVISAPRSGLRAYLSVAGGFDLPQVLGSRSTHTRERFGGFHGRPLEAGDRLACRQSPAFTFSDAGGMGCLPPSMALATPVGGRAGEIAVRVVPAGEYDRFDKASQDALWQTPWTVTLRSNRMGYSLSGVALKQTDAVEMRSHGIVSGVVQVPPSGQPVIQLADANSAGGYPKIGVVIDADLWRIAQLAPRGVLRFVRCTLAEARAAEREIATYMETLRRLAGDCRQPLPARAA